MIVKATMLLLLLIAGVSLAVQGIVFLVSEFLWITFFQVLSVSLIMVFFPCLYLGKLIINYRFWKYSDIEKIIEDTKKSLEGYSSKGGKFIVLKKGKDYFISEVQGIHTKFVFVFYKRVKIGSAEIQRILTTATEIKTDNILLFCTGSIEQEAKEQIRSKKGKFIFEDYKQAGDFNLKKYFCAPAKK